MLPLKYNREVSTGSNPSLTAADALRLLTVPPTSASVASPVAIDVRSETEFAHGSFPQTRLAPILRNDERHQVGLAYKQFGPESAKKLGFDLVGPVRDERVAAWKELHAQGAKFLFCWRGGLRSLIAADWLRDAGIQLPRVGGGYKAIRNLLLVTMERAVDQLACARVITGRTGSGKTEFLKLIRSDGPSVLDLEALAQHRGSSFGRWMKRQQPSQTSFENALALEWTRSLQSGAQVWMEDESAFIGAVQIPKPFRRVLEAAPTVELLASDVDRQNRIFREYILDPINHGGATVVEVEDFMQKALARIRRNLGGLKTDELSRELKAVMSSSEWRAAESHRGWIGGLLRFYYDPLYDYSLKKMENSRPIVFRGSADEVRAWVQLGKS